MFQLVPPTCSSFFHFLLKECVSCTILLLLISAVLCICFGIIEEGPKYGWRDGLTILVVTFFLVIVRSVTNFLRGRKLAMKKLLNKKKLEVVVVREGDQDRLVAVSDVVEGDLVHLSQGDRIPADGLFVDGTDHGLVLDEVLECYSNINCHRNPFLFSGSKVIDGNGRMMVTSVGTNTAMGELMTSHDPNKDTCLLMAQIDNPNVYAEYIALTLSIIVMFVLFLRFLYNKDGNDDVMSEHELPKMEAKDDSVLPKMIMIFERILFRPKGMAVRVLTTSLTSVVLLLGLQQGVHFVIALSLSCWNRKVNKCAAQPNPTACCTMGMATVVCINASSGLLCHQVEVNQVWIGDRNINNRDNSSSSGISQALLEALGRVVSVSAHEPEIFGSPTDGLLISWLSSKLGMNNKGFPREGYSILDSRKYNNEAIGINNKAIGVLVNENDGEENVLLHKGDASTILPMCSHYYDCEGKSHAMGNQRSGFEKVIKHMAEDSCNIRPIAFAYSQKEVQEIGDEDGLNLLAVVGFKKNPCWEAVEALKKAGVSIKLVSRDDLEVVRAIAIELGIVTGSTLDHEAVEGEAFQSLDDDRAKLMDHTTMMYKSSPKDTLLMVKALKQRGHVVAYFGGITRSDVPALKEADVGITEETRSTEMARESCDMIVPSYSAFSSFITILKPGRCVYNNIQKFNQLMLTPCISELLISSVATMCFGDSPITAIQLLWVNWIMCLPGGGLMMLMELPITTHEPAKRAKSFMTRNFMTQVLYQTVGLLIFLFAGQAKAMIFNSFTLCQIFNLLNVMELEKQKVFKVVLNKHFWFWGFAVAVLVLQVLVVEFGTSLANYESLNWVQWTFCFLFSALSWGFDRAVKFIVNWVPYFK